MTQPTMTITGDQIIILEKELISIFNTLAANPKSLRQQIKVYDVPGDSILLGVTADMENRVKSNAMLAVIQRLPALIGCLNALNSMIALKIEALESEPANQVTVQ